MGHPRGTTVRSTRYEMSKRATFFRRMGSAVLLAVVALSAGVPASADDGPRRGHRAVEEDAAISTSGVEWTRLLGIDPLGVEWSLRD
jgi:hypothetical protein